MARWTREELLLALGLYFETPFGKQHKTYPPIVALAERIGRTPSAVAMKLNNFTSLDPVEAARGIKGLTGASNADREIWSEFDANKAQLVNEIESLLEGGEPDSAHPRVDTPQTPSGPTTQMVQTVQRRHQQFFRRVVLGSYGSRCCVTGLPVPTLLRASHIVPWKESENHRLNPCNGLCLSATYDAAFDRGLISFDSDLRLLIGSELRAREDCSEVSDVFLSREGERMQLPEKNLPDLDLVGWHREKVFDRRCKTNNPVSSPPIPKTPAGI